MKHIDITIEGKTPLLCNRFHDEAAADASNGSRVNSIAGDKGTPLEQCELKLYKDEDGTLIIPQPNIFRSIIDAGTYFKMGKSKVTTIKSSIIPACVDMDELYYPLIHKEPWTVDTRPIVNPATGGRRLCHRPCFHDWKVSFSVDLDTDILGAKLFREIVDAAGRRIGLGDYRPARKGPFGKYVVTYWKETP